MNILDFENTSTYRFLLIQESSLSDDAAFCVLTCLLDLENKQYVNFSDWNALIQEHCQYGDIPGGMCYALRKYVTEHKSESIHSETLIKLSDLGQAMLDQIRLELCIDEDNATMVGLLF